MAKKPPTALALLKQHLKIKQAQRAVQREELKLKELLRSTNVWVESVSHGDTLYRLTVRGGMWPQLEVEVLGTLEELSKVIGSGTKVR